ncbi:MAG: hypothetical protein KAJ19_16500 [Gammaproteobacteria bacterium]|nr:hypothetical protein [Gammaproteobacteria bacterium]
MLCKLLGHKWGAEGGSSVWWARQCWRCGKWSEDVEREEQEQEQEQEQEEK